MIYIPAFDHRLPFRLNEPAKKEASIGLSVRTGGEYQHPLSPAWRLRAGGDLPYCCTAAARVARAVSRTAS